jgi:hypothetical protein
MHHVVPEASTLNVIGTGIPEYLTSTAVQEQKCSLSREIPWERFRPQKVRVTQLLKKFRPF